VTVTVSVVSDTDSVDKRTVNSNFFYKELKLSVAESTYTSWVNRTVCTHIVSELSKKVQSRTV